MFLWCPLIFLALVSPMRVAHAQHPASQTASEPMNDEKDRGLFKGKSIDERMFIQSLVSRRNEHLQAVKKIRKLKSYEEKYKITSILAGNVMAVVESSRAIIGSTKFVPGDSTPLKNITVRAALSTILANSALFGEVVLQLPNIAHRVIKLEKNWNKTIHWSLNFANETRHLLDKPTFVMFHLLRQELNIIPRESNYSNPFWSENSGKTTSEKAKKNSKKNSKDNKKKKGPRMVNIEL